MDVCIPFGSNGNLSLKHFFKMDARVHEKDVGTKFPMWKKFCMDARICTFTFSFRFHFRKHWHIWDLVAFPKLVVSVPSYLVIVIKLILMRFFCLTLGGYVATWFQLFFDMTRLVRGHIQSQTQLIGQNKSFLWNTVKYNKLIFN